MENYTFKENDKADTLTATLADDDNPDGKDITGFKDVKLLIKDRTGSKVLDKSVTVTNASNGEVEYEWSNGDIIETAGVYRAEFKVIDATDEPETFPTDGFVTIEVEEEIN